VVGSKTRYAARLYQAQEVTSEKVPKDSLEKRLSNIYYGIGLQTINGPTVFTERQQFLAYNCQLFELDFCWEFTVRAALDIR
jgi:hypothetical protein